MSQLSSPTVRQTRTLPKVNLCNVWIDQLSLTEAIAAIIQQAKAGDIPAYVVPTNVQCLALMQRNPRLRNIYNQAFLAVPDGVPLLWAARFLKTPLNGRVNGTDLMEHLCAAAAQTGLNIFFLGGRPGMAARAAEQLRRSHPSIKIVGVCCPEMGFEQDAIALSQINEQIRLAQPHLIFVGLGVPKQEYWMQDYYQALDQQALGQGEHIPVAIAVGGSFEMLAGMVSRAPQWMQRSGLEWLFRLLMEPRRLWKRYLVCNTLFIWLVLRQWLQR